MKPSQGLSMPRQGDLSMSRHEALSMRGSLSPYRCISACLGSLGMRLSACGAL